MARNYDTLIYLDPDIWIFRYLEEIYQAFSSASIVLTPHIRRPYYDNHHPSDLSILQSGTYNLGFIGLKNTKSARSLLDWWMQKLYHDCVVDIPKGLFVDQKWIDLVPGFFPDTKIIHDPSYNVAYWNLHERQISGDINNWKVDEQPLAFFHFSGYLPIAPDSISTHQNRHQINQIPDFANIAVYYGAALFQNGYKTSITWPYAFETLSNGVRLPMHIVRSVMQWASRTGVPTPNPRTHPDDFCRFLMSRGYLPERPNVVLLYFFLLQQRQDLVVAFPHAVDNSDDSDFRNWLLNHGGHEAQLQDLFPYEGDKIRDNVADLFFRLRQANRVDVFAAFQDMWINDDVFNCFLGWIATHGVKEMGFEKNDAECLSNARAGVFRIFNLYFLRGDLQVKFMKLWEKYQIEEFAEWLRQHRYTLNLSLNEISLFVEFISARPVLFEKIRFLYQNFGKKQKILPSLYAIDDRRYLCSIAANTNQIFTWLKKEKAISPADHFVAHFGRDRSILNDFSTCSVPGLMAMENFDFIKTLRSTLAVERSYPIINMAGFLTAPSGTGEAGRGIVATLKNTKLPFRAVTLPHVQAQSVGFPKQPALFGWPSAIADLSITVANADSSKSFEHMLPSLYWANKNVGYWVWETETLPHHFKNSDTLFDEIWTPSHYSAAAIRKTSRRNVRVFPHVLDFPALDRAVANRQAFGLPTEAILFGFAFDPNSILERKNVAGLVQAFQDAFRDNDRCYLVLKVNGQSRGTYEYEMIRARVDSDRILVMEMTMSHEKTFDFIKSLDVYVSLHRAEGFGLTCAEAMALGLPVIASQYSGNLDFMTEQNSLLVPTQVIETDRPYGPYPAGTRWGDPDLAAASHLMRTLLDVEKRRFIGEEAARSIRKTLAPELLANQLKDMIADILNQDKGYSA
ncbi:glycosyltransferase family 4 protein [Allochromatium warmingii]|uniref:glycosyltransferase family 4 protein n=1 Tax=Allochromatium warmingii TaxID=61595 RepID=UPI0015A6A2A9|nr:glycosyltransferase [Allochromatium warmingii]